MFRVENCTACPIKSYRLMINDTTPFTGPEMSLDNQNNLVISTYQSFRQMPVYIQAFFNNATQPDCTFIEPKKITVDYEVCGTEKVIVNNETEILYFHNWINSEPNYNLNLTNMK